MITRCRLLALAAAFWITLSPGAAAGQTLIAKAVPAGSTVEFVLNTTTVGTATPNADGFATIASKQDASAAKSEIDAYIYVDTCDTVRRVLVVERGISAPAPDTGCTRAQIAGLFLVRRMSTLVVDVSGANPTVLLRRGPFTIRPGGPARVWGSSPTGLVLFGGGGLARFADASTFACGDVTPCSGDDAGAAYTFGAAFWFIPFLAAEATYLKPAEATAQGSGSNFRFNSFLDAHVVTVAGKVGAPIGPVRLYGQAGANYHRAKSGTTQTIDDVTVTIEGETRTIPGGTQTYGLETSGWGWSFGGGGEVWLTSAFALYGEFARAALKGGARDDAEGALDDSLTSVVFGARVRIGR
jgi:hypothetical protein